MKDFIEYVKKADITNLNTIEYGDIYRILNNEEIKYSACILEVISSEVNESIINTTYRISVVDKLNEDESNLLDIFDNSTRQLSDLLLYIQEVYNIDDNYIINYINQDFDDKVAGIYAEIIVQDLRYFCEYDNNV